MAPSQLAWLLRLAAFFHLCTLLAGEWVPTLPGEERKGMLGCRLHFPGENRPLLVPVIPVATGLGVGETPRRICGKHKVCREENEGWEKPKQAPG